jgi:hypothetical protein
MSQSDQNDPHFVTMCRVGATVLAGGSCEIANVTQVFQPDGRFAAPNSHRLAPRDQAARGKPQ